MPALFLTSAFFGGLFGFLLTVFGLDIVDHTVAFFTLLIVFTTYGAVMNYLGGKDNV